MAEICKWNLKTSGKTEVFDSDFKLDCYLKQYLDDVGDSELIIIPATSNQERTKQIIQNFKDEIDTTAILRTRQVGTDPEDVEYYYQIPNSIGVSRFLQIYVPEGKTSQLVTPFDDATWKQREIERYVSEGKTRDEAETLVNAIMKSWPVMSQIGTDIHSVFEWVFNGEEGELNRGQYLQNDELFNNILEQVRDFKNYLSSKYKNCEFYTEVPIISKDLGEPAKTQLEAQGYNSINGKIDLLVVDENGNGHIFDFKVSRKMINSNIWNQITTLSNEEQRLLEGEDVEEKWWHSTKKEAACYQLSLYSSILKQRGINIVDANIVPVKTQLEYEDADRLLPNGLKSAKVQFRQNLDGTGGMITNIAEVLAGKYNTATNSIIHRPVTLTGNMIDKLQHIINTFFPKNITIANREENRIKIDAYRDDPSVVEKLLPSHPKSGEYKYKFVAKHTTGKITYCETDEKLNELLQQYVNDIRRKQADDNTFLANNIDAVMKGTMTLDEFTETRPVYTRQFMKNQFSRYFDGTWSFENNPDLTTLGIFVFTRGSEVEIVTLTDKDLKAQVNLGIGKEKRYNLLGKTRSDRKWNNKEILSSTGGHMEAMKAMAYISLNADFFENKKIAELRVVNQNDATEETIDNSLLIKNYNALVSDNPDSGAKTLSNKYFMNDVAALVRGAKERFRSIGATFSGFTDSNEVVLTSEWLRTAIERLRSDTTYGAILYNEANYDPNSPLWAAYMYLKKAYLASYGYHQTLEKDISEWTTGGLKLNGLKIASMQFSPSSTIRTLGEIINKFSNAVGRQVYDEGWEMANQFRKLYKEYGTGSKIFQSMLVKDSNGKIDKRFLLKDPSDPEFAGSPVVRETLDLFLKKMAKLRWGEISQADIDAKKADGSYYELPLTEAVISRQVKGMGLFKAIKNKVNEVTELTEGIFAGSDIDTEFHATTRGSLYNKFDLSDAARRDLIDERTNGGKELSFFETDLELIFNQCLVTYTKSKISKEYLPLISALRLSALHATEYGQNKKYKDSANVNNILQNFDKLVSSKIYGKPIVDPKLHQVLKLINVFKAGFTTLTLSLNIKSFLRESLTGIWNGTARAMAKQLPGVDQKAFVEGFTHVIQEAPKNISGVSKLQQMNQVYRIANQSLSQIANQRRLNWANIKHWSKDTLFLTATSPDFLHRMGILVGKMKSDGCWDAYKLDDSGKLYYDFKSDKRFEYYIKNDYNHPEYLKQKSLYLKYIDEFNKEGFRKENGELLIEGDALPQAYTSKESQSIKNYSDTLYGHYDDESRSLICDTLFGALFMQYKTYLTAKLEQWTISKGVYNTETLVQQKDSAGNNLYEIIRYNEYDAEGNPVGMPYRDVITQTEYDQLPPEDRKNANFYYDYEGIPMEGMLQENWHFAKALVTMDQDELNAIWKDKYRRGYFLLGLHDMWLMMFMTWLVNFIFGEWLDVDKNLGINNGKYVVKAIRNEGPLVQMLHGVLTGFTQDSQFFNVIGAFTQKPPLLSAVQRLGYSSLNLIAGDSNIAHWASQNIGAIRDFQGIAKKAFA